MRNVNRMNSRENGGTQKTYTLLVVGAWGLLEHKQEQRKKETHRGTAKLSDGKKQVLVCRQRNRTKVANNVHT